MNTEEAEGFYNQYRDALKTQYSAQKTALDQKRTNDYAGIMANANTGGMMYSNLPARSKVKYDTETYNPALAKSFNTYQTGLNKLRNSATQYKNYVSAYQEAINDLNADYMLGNIKYYY